MILVLLLAVVSVTSEVLVDKTLDKNEERLWEDRPIPLEDQFEELSERIDMRKAIPTKEYYWPDATVSYSIHESVDNTLRDQIMEAMKHWMNYTCLKFKEVPEDVNYPHVIFRADDKTQCSSNTGMQFYSSSQTLHIGAEHCRGMAIAHEIGHAIGFYHEQQRSDRDENIQFFEENMKEIYKGSFRLLPSNHYGIPYDYDSLMHYSPLHGAEDPNYPVIKLHGNNISKTLLMGRLLGLSFYDKKLANIIYKCGAHCVGQIECRNLGYIDPKSNPHECRCLCPDGFGGSFCKTVIPKARSCGFEINNATRLIAPNHPVGRQCIWKIQAPKMQHVCAEFKQFDLDSQSGFKNLCESDSLMINNGTSSATYCGNTLKGKTTCSAGNEMILTFQPHSDYHMGFDATITFM